MKLKTLVTMDYQWAYRYLRKRAYQRYYYALASLYEKSYTLTIDDLAIKFCYFTPYHHARAEDYSSGTYDTPLLLAWITYAKDATVIFDVGGYCGLYGLLAKAANPSAEVYIFEPDEVNVFHIRENARINNLDVKIVPKAASDYTGVIKFAADGSTGSKVAPWGKEMPCTELSKYGAPDLMKLDVEGHEPEALRGTDISRLKYLIAEMNHPLDLPAKEIMRDGINAIFEFAHL